MIQRLVVNSIGKDTFEELSIPQRVAQIIIIERKNNGVFTNEKDFISRMNNFYNQISNSGYKVNFETKYWPTIRKIIEENRLEIKVN